MKTWITLCLAFSALTLGLASLLEATTQNYPPLPISAELIEEKPDNADALQQAITISRQAHRALEEIKVIDNSPEQLRASFTRYWSLCVELNTDQLKSEEASIIEEALQEAHLQRTKELTADIKLLPATLESEHLVNELIRGIRATSSF